MTDIHDEKHRLLTTASDDKPGQKKVITGLSANFRDGGENKYAVHSPTAAFLPIVEVQVSLVFDIDIRTLLSYHDRIDMKDAAEHTLEYLLAFDGRVHWLQQGYWLKFEIKRVEPTAQRPHGLSYSFTLHDPEGNRLIGFDNAHTVKPLGGRYKKRAEAADHWHRTSNDAGRPYAFTSAEQLLEDFFAEVSRVLAERGISDSVVDVDEKGGTS